MGHYPTMRINELSSNKHRENLNVYHWVKETIGKGYILHDWNCMTIWKRHNYGDNIKISGCQGLLGRENKQVEHSKFLSL